MEFDITSEEEKELIEKIAQNVHKRARAS